MSYSSNNPLSHEHIHLSENEDVLFQITHDTGSYVPSHWHHDIELIYLLEGELEVTLMQEVYPLKANELILINSQTLHNTKCIHGNRAVLLILPFQFVEKYYPQLSNAFFRLNSHYCSSKLEPYQDEIKHLLLSMKSAYESTHDWRRLEFNTSLFKLLCLLVLHFKETTGHLQTPFKTNQQDKLERIIQYTLANYKEPISLETIASLVSLQPEYFCRFFKKHMGLTYQDYLSDIRLSYIYQDMLTTHFPINYLLEKHGFTNEKRFRKLFKHHFHVTPREIRRTNLD